MINAAGQVVMVSPSDMARAQTQGFYIESKEAKHRRVLEERFGGGLGQLEAGAVGAARGLTFGLSDWALRSFGVSAERLQALKEANPIATGIGEYGALGLSLLPSGGASILGRAAGKVFTTAGFAPRLLSSGGRAIAETTAKALGMDAAKTGAGRALAKIVGEGVGQAVEGGVYGAGMGLSEAALGENTDSVAEHVLSSAGLGAVMGGVLGGGIAGASQLVRAGMGKIGKTFAGMAPEVKIAAEEGAAIPTGFGALAELKPAELVAAGTDKPITLQEGRELVDLFEKSSGETIQPGFRDKLAKVGQWLTGVDSAKIKRFLTPEFKEAVTYSDEKILNDSKKASGLWNQIKAYMEPVEDTTRSEKPGIFRDLVPEAKNEISSTASLNLLDAVRNIVKPMLSVKGETVQYGHQTALRNVMQLVDRTEDKVLKIIEGKGSKMGGELNGALDQFKRDWWKTIDNVMDSLDKRQFAATEIEKETARILGDQGGLYTTMQKMLEDGAVWGKKAADTQMKWNAGWTKALEDSRYRYKHRFINAHESTGGRWKVEADPAGFEGFINDFGTAKNVLDEKYFVESIDRRLGLGDIIKETGLLSDAQEMSLAKAQLAAKELKELLGKSKSLMTMKNQARQFSEQVSQLADTGSGVTSIFGKLSQAATGGGLIAGGAMIGGPIGALAGAAGAMAIKAISNPAHAMNRIAQLSRIVNDSKKILSNRLEKFTGSIGQEGKKKLPISAPVRGLATRAAVSYALAERNEQHQQDRFEKQQDEIFNILNNTAYADSRMVNSTNSIHDIAPRLSVAMQNKQKQSVQFLASKMPRPFDGMKKIPDIELRKFDRYIDAINDPTAFIDKLAGGHLDFQASEVLQNLYPELHKEIIFEVMEKIQPKMDKLTLQDRTVLTLGLGIPVSKIMQPDQMAGMQQTTGNMIASQVQGMQQGIAAMQMPPREKRLGEMTSAQRVMYT
jgi:hypothetical protein